MKKQVLIALVLSTAPSLIAQHVGPTDTVKIIEKASEVVITRRDNNTYIHAIIPDEQGTSFQTYDYKVTVNERPDSTTEKIAENIFSGLPFVNDKKKKQPEASNNAFKSQRYITGIRNIYWGWNFAYDGKEGLKNSFEVGVAEVIAIDWKPWRNGPDFRVGLGFGMKRFLAADNLTFGKQGDRLVLQPIEPDAHDVKGRWDVWSFHLPLMMKQQIYQNLEVAFGTLVNFNTYSKAWSQQEIDGVRYRTKFKGLQQRLMTCELIGIIGLGGDFGFGFYAKWNPVPVMKSCFGPEFRTWSMGVSLNF